MRRGLSIELDAETVERMGWRGFWMVERILRRRGLTAEQIEWRSCNESVPGTIHAVFEVREVPPRWLTVNEVAWRRVNGPPRSTGDVP